nr:Os05g47820-TQ [Oryza sativa]
MESSPAATVTPAAAAMSEAPAVAAPRPRDPGLFGSFDLPAAWGCRRPMAFCRDLDAAALVGSEPNAAAAAAAAGDAVEPKRNASRSPPKGGDAPVAAAAAQEAPRKQWNLRYRKGGRDGGEDALQNKKLWNMEAAGAAGGGGARASRGFSVELTRQEIDADFFAITGRKAPRKPAKRPRSVQRQVDSICPGNSLWEVSRDRYKVNEKGGF